MNERKNPMSLRGVIAVAAAGVLLAAVGAVLLASEADESERTTCEVASLYAQRQGETWAADGRYDRDVRVLTEPGMTVLTERVERHRWALVLWNEETGEVCTATGREAESSLVCSPDNESLIPGAR